MAFASEPLYKLGRTARYIGPMVAAVGLILLAVVVPGLSRPSPDRTGQIIGAAVGLNAFLSGLAMLLLSYPVERGRLWACVTLVSLCMLQIPAMILFSGAAFSALLSVFLIARCMIAIPEIRFQLRAKRRSYAVPVGGDAPAGATAKSGGVTPVASTSPATPQPPPKSLKARRGT